jgi:hypothetical protein
MKYSRNCRCLIGLGLCACIFSYLACGGPIPVGGNAGGGSNASGGGASGSGHSSSTIDITPATGSGGGQRSSNTPNPDANCGVSTNDLTRSPADVLLVLDTSGSMVSNKMASGATRWADVTKALNQALPATDASLNWGLMQYPGVSATTTAAGGRTGGRGGSSGSSGNSCAAGVVDVPIKPLNASTVMAAYQARTPNSNSNTPTKASIDAAVAYLKQSTSPNPKYIVLATDGEPNCGSGTSSDVTTQTIADAVSAIETAKAAGISVFVVGISTAGTTASGTLDKMAVAGGQALSTSPRYYSVNTSDELVTAMSSISGQIATCTFTMTAAPPDPGNVVVQFSDGSRAGRDTSKADGWDYIDGTYKKIQLFGPPCDKVMNGTLKDVKILFGCPGMSFQ